MEEHHRSHITKAEFSFVRSSDPMLLAPLRAWTAHVMQLRPVGIENCARQRPQEHHHRGAEARCRCAGLRHDATCSSEWGGACCVRDAAAGRTSCTKAQSARIISPAVEAENRVFASLPSVAEMLASIRLTRSR